MSTNPMPQSSRHTMLLGTSNSSVNIFSPKEAKPGGPQITINPDGPPLLVAGCQLLDVLFFRQSRKGSLLLSEKCENDQESSLALAVGDRPCGSAFCCHFWGTMGAFPQDFRTA
jgi:hypothetical protein